MDELELRKSERTDEGVISLVIIMLIRRWSLMQYSIIKLVNVGMVLTLQHEVGTYAIVEVRENPEFEGNFLPEYGEPFSERFDTYHRLDVRFERKTDFFV